MGIIMELYMFYVVESYDIVELEADGGGTDSWVVYETDDVGIMGEGGVGVAALYSCASWLMVVAGWSLFVGVVIIIEITRG